MTTTQAGDGDTDGDTDGDEAGPGEPPPSSDASAGPSSNRTTVMIVGAAIAVIAVALAGSLAWRGGADDTAPASAPPSTPPAAEWQLTFADEFDGDQVDPDRWHVYDEANGDEVESPKVTTCPQAGNVTVSDGILVMATRRAEGSCAGGQAHSGAGLSTSGRFSQAGGRFEVRARWTAAGNYLWGGFWTHGNIGPDWRRDDPTEIDVFEYIGRDAEPNRSRFRPAIHYDYSCGGPCGSQNVERRPHDVTAWHTYTVEWQPAEADDPATMQIRFLLDGELIAVFDRDGAWRVGPDGRRTLETEGGWGNRVGPFPNPFGFDRPHQLILSAWVGAPDTDPATVAAGFTPPGGQAALEVDYVRVYAHL